MTDIWVTTWTPNAGPTNPIERLHDTEEQADATKRRLVGSGVRAEHVVVYPRAAGEVS